MLHTHLWCLEPISEKSREGFSDISIKRTKVNKCEWSKNQTHWAQSFNVRLWPFLDLVNFPGHLKKTKQRRKDFSYMGNWRLWGVIVNQKQTFWRVIWSVGLRCCCHRYIRYACNHEKREFRKVITKITQCYAPESFSIYLSFIRVKTKLRRDPLPIDLNIR